MNEIEWTETNECTNEWNEQRMNEWMNEWMNERTNEWMNERMYEWMNEWKRTNKRTNDPRADPCHPAHDPCCIIGASEAIISRRTHGTTWGTSSEVASAAAVQQHGAERLGSRRLASMAQSTPQPRRCISCRQVVHHHVWSMEHVGHVAPRHVIMRHMSTLASYVTCHHVSCASHASCHRSFIMSCGAPTSNQGGVLHRACAQMPRCHAPDHHQCSIYSPNELPPHSQHSSDYAQQASFSTVYSYCLGDHETLSNQVLIGEYPERHENAIKKTPTTFLSR
jgi:hypothetical protein